MTNKTLTQAVQDMLDAVKALSTSQGIDWTDPVYAPVALAHAHLTDALKNQVLLEDVCVP